MDFEKLYPYSIVSLYQKWDKFIDKIIALRKPNVNNASALEDINNLENVTNERKFSFFYEY